MSGRGRPPDGGEANCPAQARGRMRAAWCAMGKGKRKEPPSLRQRLAWEKRTADTAALLFQGNGRAVGSRVCGAAEHTRERRESQKRGRRKKKSHTADTPTHTHARTQARARWREGERASHHVVVSSGKTGGGKRTLKRMPGLLGAKHGGRQPCGRSALQSLHQQPSSRKETHQRVFLCCKFATPGVAGVLGQRSALHHAPTGGDSLRRCAPAPAASPWRSPRAQTCAGTRGGRSCSSWQRAGL